MIGLWEFFERTTLRAAASVVTLLLVFYAGYLGLNFFYYVTYVQKVKALVRS